MTGPASYRSEVDPTGTRVVAFLAPTSRTGRTNLVSNLAWILARAGRRVLVVDAGRGTVRVHEHLRMFHTDEWPVAEQLPTGLARLLFPGTVGRGRAYAEQPKLRRYAAPPGRLDVVWLPESSLWPPLDELGDAPRTELRRQLRFTEYDFVLLDAVDSEPMVARWAAVLCEVVAVCFPYRYPRLPEVAALARQVHRAAPAGVRLVGVATAMDEYDPTRAEQRRDAIRRGLLGALDDPTGPVDLTLVEVPGAATEQTLAPLMEESPHRNRLFTAYGELLRLVTDGVLGTPRPEPETARNRYRYGLGRQAAEDQSELCLAFPGRQRPWADWIRAELTAVGVLTRPGQPGDEGGRPAGPATVLAVAAADGSDDQWLSAVVGAAGNAELLVARTGPADVDQPPDDAGRIVVDLTGCTEEQARERVRGTLGLAGIRPLTVERAWRPGFPGGRDKAPDVYDLPSRPRLFVGRDRELGELRDLLLTGTPGQPVVVEGPAAVGKTSIAVEYAHRFYWDYRLIVWIAAGGRHDVRAALAGLAKRLGVEPRGNPVQEALRELGRRGDQWLVVYDGVGDEDLEHLLPTGSGHVVVTRRTGAEPPPGTTATVTVGQLVEADAVRLLTERVRGLSATPAAAVVAAVGASPLDLRLASGLLGQAGILLNAEHAVADSRAADTAVPAFCAAVAEPADAPAAQRILRVALALMQEEFSGRVAAVVAQMCAFASPLGLSQTILNSRAMRGQIARGLSDTDGAMLRADGWELDRALATAVRFRLVEVTWGRQGTVRMHPAVQAVLLADLSDQERADRRSQFLSGLAEVAPRSTAADDPVRDEMHRHLISSGGLDADGPDEVRRWLVEQLEFLIHRGGHEAPDALRRWRPVLDRWLARYGWNDRFTLRLATRLADVTRMLGHGTEALELSRTALREGATLLGADHPWVLVTRRGLAGDLRGLGKFRAALVEDQATWRGFRDQFGNSHPETLVAAHNLASSFHLAGRSDEALRVAQRTRARRLRLFDEANYNTLWLTSDIGGFLRELGELEEARWLLDEARRRRSGASSDEDVLLLRIIRNLAVTERRRGQLNKAKELNGRAYLALRRQLGEDNPMTRSGRLSLAVDYHLARESDHAARLVEESLAGYETDLGPGHPFTHVCRSLRAVVLRARGRVEEAVVDGEKAAAGLVGMLGEPHPWALGGLVNQAGNLAVAGRPEVAEQLLRTVVEQGRDFLGPDHPCLRTARRVFAAVVSDGEVTGSNPGAVPFDFVDMEVPET
ncbi:FxSxx-COOH system tetratricopeptide repeat protein [Micromonospora cathayae]|uniref:FxSxx-COOH system tetratricopeptide repeat protein n=1 Tax=Micromonospora cathayae TaxID=3028804 RepID=A0ABY7ZVT4_9ACTN|nr:FxSxx-COOH system tetratricopeptide repeat protein [Micromonospora sp. HUAS 3]WDZ86926.1 FxSxx-COOH system tetratricopeptide repeat protein [Micromonospora sp. HUAS 3]